MRKTIHNVMTAVSFLVCAVGLEAQQTQANTPVTTVPRLIRITNSFRPVDGSPISPVESVTLSVYKDEQGGTPLWQETQNVAVGAAGRYSALMGSTLPDGMPLDLFASEEPRWLGVRFNRPGESEQPRVLLVSVPYALKASDADTLGGRPASAYLLDPNAVVSGSGSNGSGSGTASASGAARAAIAGKTLQPRTVTGDMNYLPYFTDSSNDLGDSLVYQTNGRIGLNTTSPFDFLHVRFTNTNGAFTGYAVQNLGNTATSYSGMLFFDQNGALGQFQGFNNVTHEYRINNIATSGSINFMLGSVSKFLVAPSGNIGIGNTSPAFAVDVAGTVNASNPVSTGSANGVQGTSNSPNGAGVNGFNSVTSSGFPVGVEGSVNGTVGAGVSGNASQAGAAGVTGYNSATTGYAVGVQGGTASSNGAGVQGNASVAGASGVNGFNSATTGYAVGVSGGTASNNGAGVSGNSNRAGVFGTVGFNSATSGYAVGTEGASSSPGGVGLLGVDWNCSGGTGCLLVPGIGLQLQTATTGTLIQGQSGAAGANNGTAVTVFTVDGQGNANFAGTVTSAGSTQTTTSIVGGNALSATNNASSGFSIGVKGASSSTGGVGVYGINTASSGFAIGVQGTTNSPNGGGVLGVTSQASGWGVQGSSNATTGSGVGVFAESASPNGTALLAQSQSCGASSCNIVAGTAALLETATTGLLLRGVSGTAGNSNGTATQVFSVDGQGNANFSGVVNATISASNNAAVSGSNNVTTGSAVGVYGSTASNGGTGVSAGIFGVANQAGTADELVAGTLGYNSSGSGYAVGTAGASASSNGVGIVGASMACAQGSTCALAAGVAGELEAASTGILLQGMSGTAGNAPSTATQVFAIDGQGNATFHNVTVNGTLSKSAGSFRIDDPIDPDNKYLYHSFVESPDMMDIYNGVVAVDEKGEATVTLPAWFEALNRDFRYQLTCIGGYAPVYVASEVSGNQFRIAGGRPGLKISWQVTGIRHDSYANAHRIPVEEEKPVKERRGSATSDLTGAKTRQ